MLASRLQSYDIYIYIHTLLVFYKCFFPCHLIVLCGGEGAKTDALVLSLVTYVATGIRGVKVDSVLL